MIQQHLNSTVVTTEAQEDERNRAAQVNLNSTVVTTEGYSARVVL